MVNEIHANASSLKADYIFNITTDHKDIKMLTCKSKGLPVDFEVSCLLHKSAPGRIKPFIEKLRVLMGDDFEECMEKFNECISMTTRNFSEC